MKNKLSKVYFEITNVCNASCSFCPKTKREKCFVSEEEFDAVTKKLQDKAEYLYFHLMGEPLLHPSVVKFAEIAKKRGFKVMITTNGLLSDSVGKELISSGDVFKISFSLHSFEANKYSISKEQYLKNCFSLAEAAAERGTIAVLRLWNSDGGEDNAQSKPFSEYVLSQINEYFKTEPTKNRSGLRIKDKIFVEWGERFFWPGQDEEKDELFCHAISLQLGILSNGDVVPCCLDNDGGMVLGNIFDNELEDILQGDMARNIRDSFSLGRAPTELCRKCGFARRFSVKK